MNYKDKYVGLKIHGYGNGSFGRDSYLDKVVIASGEDWLVAKDDDGVNLFANFDDAEDMSHAVNDWIEDNKNVTKNNRG